MKHRRIIAALALGLSVSACTSIDTASRNAPLESTAALAAEAPSAAVQSVAVQSYTVKVPRSLRVSEANTYYPMGDIVWREDPIGDRHAQVADIFNTSVSRAVETVDGALPVVAEIVVKRFHALTEKTRYTIGGVHSITFDLILRDPETGLAIMPPREISADLKGFGGSRAIAAERQGVTQKLRITRHLANVIRMELEQPGSAPKGVTELVAGLEVNPI
ncbi:hypothetical protein M8756_09580 [Lutimaribacter sp. EGI FJ00015]|uniref:Uncharacterized protein n=1 Tax=Lutimaribacter degradans TaxID=2945989 RepID=A0ACC5ZVP3_9RHOB|nr:DUF6778 family protein [Lutimaribacter sp. EGI FJ00013]MCM2562399.1 hypothetical protein [Lutimaribacter sp. EGI FJ00013]MCO0613556.1 hypothetical protein [Lutimaribacter sp. EGI FJ00015]MCO0636528.1 hypothetical protein [Lutimaribacter sp. EGI FJ00014]